MDDVWNSLHSAAVAARNPLWDDFVKEGRESAVLAPLGRCPNAASWLARSMGSSTDCTTRKLAAMLAGWVIDSKHVNLLPEMLDYERRLFPQDGMNANSVAEDIMFAATRWGQSKNPEVGNAGKAVLAEMISDALGGTSWNTAHWAVANLYRATNGQHDVFERLTNLPETQIEGQKLLQNAVRAIKQRDLPTLNRLVTPPPEEQALSADDHNYPIASALWSAAVAAEATVR